MKLRNLREKPEVSRALPLLLATLLGIVWPPPLPAAEDPPSEQQLAAINTAIADVEAWLEQASRERPEYEQNLQATETQLSAISREIAIIHDNIEAKSNQLDALQQRQRLLEEQKRQQSELVAQLLRSAYMEGPQGVLNLVLNQQDSAKLGRMLHYYQLIQERRRIQTEEYEQTLTNLETTELELLSTNNELSEQRDRLALRQRALEAERQSRQRTLSNLETAIAQRGAELQALLADRQTLAALLEEVRRAVEKIPVPDSHFPLIRRQGELPWPGQGPLVSKFGERFGNGELQRQGITIGAETGDPVRAVHGGRVVFANWLRGSGLLVILDHGDGYLTLYGHNETLLSQQGDWVDAGQAIATAGDSGGQQQTGIYFEIRHHGRPVNPIDWLVPAER